MLGPNVHIVQHSDGPKLEINQQPAIGSIICDECMLRAHFGNDFLQLIWFASVIKVEKKHNGF